MKKERISYNKLILYILTSVESYSHASILNELSHLSSIYRLSTIKYLFVIIVMFIIKYDYNISHHEQVKSPSVLVEELEKELLDLF